MRQQTRAARSAQQDTHLEQRPSPESRAVEFAALHSGQPLEGGVRDAMEGRFDHSFGNVRVHDDSQAMNSASSVSAKAYTVGSQIVLGGQVSSRFGAERILAHELAHVVQNERFGIADNQRISQNHDPAELEAHGAASRSSSASISTPPSAAIATWPDWLDETVHTVGQFGSGVMQEGLGGLDDISGMMDRQRSQDQLRQQFQVVDDGFIGPHSTRQVSEAELQRLAHEHSDVHLGRDDSSLGLAAGATDAERSQARDRAMRGLAQEGMTGLDDLSGAVDRQHAQEELANRFSVVPDDFVGPRLPNQVTQSEYQQVAHTYSDIRLGRGDLTIDTSSIDSEAAQGSYGMTPEAYRAGAMNDIASMMQTRSGRSEIEALHNNPLVSDAGEARNDFMGFELPQLPFNVDAGLGNPIHHHTTMVPLLNATGGVDRTNGYAAPDGSGSERDAAGARGAGSDVHIRYNPGVNIGDSRPDMHGTNPWMESFRSDVLLAHEMNHAIQQTQGTGDSTAVQASDDSSSTGVGIDAAYRDADGNPLRRIEHQAVGIGQSSGNEMTENAYRRERRAMADLGAVGLIVGRDGVSDGDTVLTERDSYVGHPSSAPAPAPAPSGPGVPAVPNAPWPMPERD